MRETSEPRELETLASRIQWIIGEQQIKQVDFARALGISANYVYLLTSGRKTLISGPLARLIESTYGYSAEWILTGKRPENNGIAHSDLQNDTIQKVKQMDNGELRAVAAFIRSLQNMDRE
jgi:transcriptional regulator with XRE-family HTH domain